MNYYLNNKQRRYIEMSAHFATLKTIKLNYKSQDHKFKDNTLSFQSIRIARTIKEDTPRNILLLNMTI